MYALQPSTQIAVLLCAHTGNDPVQPLSPTEYIALTSWMNEKGYPAEVLLSPDTYLLLLEGELQHRVPAERLKALLDRGAQLALWMERWSNAGMWIASWEDEEYPLVLRSKLRQQAPVLLYGFGNPNLLQRGGLAIVGSRNTNEALLEAARRIANRCALQSWTVISGGAKGVDKAAMQGALEEGGTCVGVLAADLARTATLSALREYLLSDKLCLVSPYHPQSGFTAGNAMGRNKIIYALAEFALVVACEKDKGGTWAGAMENLRNRWTPLFVYTGEGSPEDSKALLSRGAYAFPTDFESRLREQLEAISLAVSAEQMALPIEA
ncbi:MAG: DNA-processing protein DprA [Armatimonadota bacterium]